MLLMNHTQQPAGMQDSVTSAARRLADGDIEKELEFCVSNEVFVELLYDCGLLGEEGCS